MEQIVIKMRQGKKRCEAKVKQAKGGKIEIDLGFAPSYPEMRGTLYEKLVIAIYNTVKEYE